LYKGWEHLNSLIKTFYFRRTQRGGAVNAGRGEQSRLLPIARWLLRRTMWATGVSFEEMGRAVVARRRANRPFQHDNDDEDMEEGWESDGVDDGGSDGLLFGEDGDEWDELMAG
jgi:hypothetical protein